LEVVSLWTLISRKGAVEILAQLKNGPKRFNQLARVRVKRSRINRVTLNERLRELQLAGLVSRTVRPARPPYAVYKITKKGGEVLNLIDEIKRRVKEK
jgi:DNA-binding HxlR family transcriptional regulator